MPPRPLRDFCRLGAPSVLIGLALAGLACATGSSLGNARLAEQQEDYDLAVVAYTKAVREHPDDRNARLGLERARLRAAEQHFASGRRLTTAGRHDEALVEYQLAYELNPTAGVYEEALREARRQARTRIAVRRDGQTALEALIERMRDVPPPGLDLPGDATLPDSLIFRDASTRDIFLAIGQLAGIGVAFDPAFRDATLSIDLRGAALADALRAVAASTRHFYRVTAPRTITVIPDTAAKRREYEEEIVRTFYLGNADIKETIDMLRVVVDLRRVAAITATNAVSIKDTPERVAAAARLINAIDKGRAEVVIDVELLEVDRRRLRDYGLQIASPGSAGVDGFVTIDRDDMTMRTLLNLTQSDVFLANMPSLFYRLLKRDDSTRTLASPRLRTSEGLSAQARFGERVPVPITTFAPIATGGVSQQPITSFEYQNIGVNLDITPRIHHNDDVSLTLQIEVSNISGTGFGDLPTFGNRQITTTLRLRDGETNMLAGLIRDDERTVLEGIPGLSDLPVIGRLFARTRRETQETDIILTLTPHIVRVLEINEADLRPFRIERDAGAGAPLDEPEPLPAFEEPELPEEPVEEEIEPEAPTMVPGPILPPDVPRRPPPPPPPPL